jgi:hypothetical protein
MEILVSQNPATKFYRHVIFVVDPAEYAMFEMFSPLAAGQHQLGHPPYVCG